MADSIEHLYDTHIRTVKDRHDRALAETGFQSIVIYGGSQHIAFLDDYGYPFKVNPHLKSWVPVINNPHCFIIYTPGEKPVLLHYQPIDFWLKPAAHPVDFWVDEFDIRPIKTPDDALQHMPKHDGVALIGEVDSYTEKWDFAQRNPQQLLDFLHYQRAWKTGYEIECLRRANRLGVEGHLAAEEAFRLGASEWEIHLAYLRAASHGEAELPYGNIIAHNENCSVLHYQHQERSAPSLLHAFLIDAGAQYNGYASDITRTYSRENDEFQSLIDAMDAGQLEICAAVKPGVDYRDLHFDAHRMIGRILNEFDFIDVSGDDAFEKKITSTFFPHGLGHYLGLQVHDVGGFLADEKGATIAKPEGHPFLRLTRKIEPAHVFTIEPGLYFIDSLLEELRQSDNAKHVNWSKVDSFRKYGGIRVEDDLAVTETGAENLTRDAFRAVKSTQA